MKYVRTMDDSFPIAYEMDKPTIDMPVMFFDGTIAHFQDDDAVRLGHPRCKSFNMRRKHIIKEADSIEELCDLYYMAEKKYPQHNYMLKWVDIPLEDRHEYYIYAMIKTTDEHGAPIIKSAAKWNEKGEWELL